MKKLYFPFVMLIELIILAAFVWFMVNLFPTLDPNGYLYYGDAPHVPYLTQYVSTTAVTVVRWAFYIVTALLILFMMFTIIGELVRWWLNHGRYDEPYNALPGSPDEEKVVRFKNPFQIWHYLLMFGFTFAGIIGIMQAFPDWGAGNAFFERLGLHTMRNFHHYFAYFIDFTLVYFILYFVYKLFIKKEKMRAMLPTFKDLVDMIQMNLYIFGFEKEEPDYDRYTFGQKIDFFLILLGVPTLSVTGLAMHYTWISEPVISGMGVALAAVIHRSVALFLSWFIITVHIYYAHLSPGLFPTNTVILTGKMPRSRYKALFPLDSERLEGKK